MKRVGLMVCRLIGWAALFAVGLALIGFCVGIGLGLEDIRRESDGLRFAVGIVVSVGMITAAGPGRALDVPAALTGAAIQGESTGSPIPIPQKRGANA